MKLHSPRFEKVLRREIKSAVRNSSVLKKEYRQANKAASRRRKLHWPAGVVLSLAAGFVTWSFVRQTGRPATGLAAINLMALFLAAQCAASLPKYLFGATDIPALSLLPVPESEVFRWELQKFFRKVALYSLLAMLAAYGGLGFYLQLSVAHWMATFVLAIMSWLTLLALGAFFTAWFPRAPYEAFTGMTYTFGFVLVMTWRSFGGTVLRFIDQIAPALNLVLPTGWCPSLFELLLPGRLWMVVVLVIPITLIIWTLKSSLELLRSRLTFKEYVRPEIPDQVPGDDANASGTTETAEPSRVRLGPTAIEEIVQSRQFLARDDWARRGWIEKLLWRWLNARQKTLAEFAYPKGISITRQWIVLLRNFSVTILAGFLAGRADTRFEYWIIGISLIVNTAHALVLILGNGSCFRPVLSSGIQMHRYAAYPITFRELSDTLLKVSAVQLPLFVAYALVCAVLISYLTWTPYSWSIIAGFKLALLIFSSRFITTTLAFSACTNDTARFRLPTIALVLTFLGSALFFLVLGGASLFVSNTHIQWILWFVAMASAYGLSCIYGWFHNANQFDLMNVRR